MRRAPGAVRLYRFFAHAESAVSETLLRLSEDPKIGCEIKLRHLVGQKFEDLNAALTSHFPQKGKKAAEALAKFRTQEHLRPALCHGVAKLAIDRHGQWLVILKLVAFRGRKVERSATTIEQREADALLKDLQEDGRALASALQSFRARLPAVPTTD